MIFLCNFILTTFKIMIGSALSKLILLWNCFSLSLNRRRSDGGWITPPRCHPLHFLDNPIKQTRGVLILKFTQSFKFISQITLFLLLLLIIGLIGRCNPLDLKITPYCVLHPLYFGLKGVKMSNPPSPGKTLNSYTPLSSMFLKIYNLNIL